MMQAHVGDWLTLPPASGSPHPRRGQIVGLLHPDGTPPYRVHWLDDDRFSILYPPPDAQLRAAHPEPPIQT
ncbi:DUF1918 domain-containing protein [Pseudonocardia acaciae]|uniref:DUF1918 domain-containing protein n=1 Tax=Pseudonocardia acaciae TaxID=551276 RepID=UPI0009FBE5C2|nr:DUF1918 domain-containing protein [Pseudonocardia acaciae]